jgi:acetyl-CoA C-acetyltransferase
MAERIGIVAVAQTRFEKKKSNQRFQEMLWEVVKDVREQTGLSFGKGQIDNAVTCSNDFFDCRTISDAPMGDLVGAHYGPEEKNDQDGLQGVFYAAAQVASGHSEITIVAGHCKESQVASRNMVTHCAFDPIFSRQVGLDYINAAALQARVYIDRYKVKPEQLAAAVVRDRRNGALNPKAQLRQAVTINQVLNSKMVCDPLRELEIYPQSDGAVALILAGETRAKKLCKNPVWILGAGNCYDAYYLGDRNLAESKSLELAAKRAYKMAKLKNPAKELDLLELCAGFSYEELLFLEGLGIAAPGKAGAFISSGATDLGGELPVNASGGKLCGNPLMLGGMARAAECVLQLRGEAGEHQVQGAKKALAQGTTGPAGQHHCVMIFSNQ